MAFTDFKNSDFNRIRRDHWISVSVTLVIALAVWVFLGLEAMAGVSLLFLLYQTSSNGIGGLERDFLARERYRDLRGKLLSIEDRLDQGR
jgi:hypothetical protein